ncbi:hypothetical protein CLG96_02130 [Sphingomonas oleivorans]|uniref:DUF2147 domain-containing protein n=1 Tax=Sphingomonas oleivorans TaxID=1735121 RepID=A0A2T5G1D8_9SPHN|nr:hypothetical protein [Sphingomonas oleivorans]PTQ12963.1 hypothetical protein CLG96_02130 [Sphingomonas oleivorans]
MMRAIAFLAVTLATPGMAADQFDLVCVSKTQTVRYRVDLAKGEACSDSCDRVWKMGEATTGELRLIDKRPDYRGDLEERSVVSRQSGEWHYDMSMSGSSSSRDGKCDPAPFSGFPAAKF